MNNNIISLCSKTIYHFKNLLKKDNSKYLFIGVKSGGCNGLKYIIKPTNEKPIKIDEQIKINNINITLCGKSLIYLIGTEIKWTEDYTGSKLEFFNPNALSSCGCGDTFSI